MPRMLESAVVVTVDIPALDAIYRDAYPAFVELDIPLHVTLLHPFVPPLELDAALRLLREVFARHNRFDFSLTDLRTFPNTVWVAPEPAAPFRALTEAIETAFPEYPHSGGRFAEMIPHMTLADQIEEGLLESTLARLRPRVEPLLPLTVAADEVTVLAERADGQWVVAALLPLATD
jgi:2'-5' RNA ligase